MASSVISAIFLTFLLCLVKLGNSATPWGGLIFTTEPRSAVVMKSAPAWLHCGAVVADGRPDPTITWRKDGYPISADFDSRKVVLPNGTLYFKWVNDPQTERTDEGVYQCVASSYGLGKIVSATANLSVLALNKFDAEPEDITVFEGERARFPCSIKGSPAPEIRWFRDSQAMDLGSRMTLLPSGALEIENVDVLDEGQYYCHATSLDKTKVSHGAMLRVKEAFALRDPMPPTFAAKPTSVITRVGSNVTLDCAANGYPDPTIVWLKDGATIDMADLDTRFHFFGTTRSLQILDVKEEDAGTYMCRAENREDSADAVAHVDVQVPPKFVVRPTNTIGYEKQDVELECRVYGKPEPTVHWLKNAEVIGESSYFQMVNGHNLKILGMVEGDSGMYQCIASNAAGYAQASAQLRVLKSKRRMSVATSVFDTSHWNKGIPEAKQTLAPSVGRGGGAPREREEDETLDASNFPLKDGQPSAPRNLQAIIASNRFVTLAWHEPELNNRHIVGYSVFYRQEGSLRERVQNVSASSSSEGLDEYKTQIGHLTPGSTYEVRVVAHTSTGMPGLSSDSVSVSTKPDLDLPTAPQDLRVMPTSPTSLEASWGEPSPPSKTPVTGYVMYYMQVGSAEEHDVEVSTTGYTLNGLDEFTEYSVWVVAQNANGAGDATHEVTGRTFSDAPSREPQNVTVEAASSQSLILRWEPPPTQDQNGVITGYKIRYKEKGKAGSTKTKTTDGNRRLYVLTDLRKSTQYSIKLSALTVNGTGPSTHWIQAETFANDLDENKVPEQPTNLEADPMEDHIQVRWQPPKAQNVMVRGYTIGWGRGIPDVYTNIVDSKQRSYTIDGLEPNGEYVISLRAFNNIGAGAPVYEQVRTKPPEPEVAATLTPPVGLKTEVLTPFTIALQWTDRTLNSNQFISDTRYYTVRYTTYASSASSSPRYKYRNASDVTCLLDNLKPNTVYEFAVKTIKGRRESPYSLVTSNTTLQARPSSPPRDVTVVLIPGEPHTIVFNWQPPKQANGKITGYLIFYTTDATGDWVMEEVLGDRMTFSVHGLTPATLYYYRMQARNVKGFGPFSSVGNFTTFPGPNRAPDGQTGWFVDRSSLIVLIGAGVAGAIIVLGAIIAVGIYCRRAKPLPRHNNLSNPGSKPGTSKPEVKPPDLWIHHDHHLEMKNLDKGGERSTSPNHETVIDHPDYDREDKNNTYTSTSTLDRRTPYQSTYLRDPDREDERESLLNRRSFRPIVGGSTSSSVYSDGTLGRPGYSMPQFSSAASQGYNSPAENPYSPNPTSTNIAAMLGPTTLPPPPPTANLPLLGLGASSGSNSQYSSLNNAEGSNTLGKRCGNPLRSFSVPGPPQSAPTTPQPKHMVGMRPPQSGVTSPFKKSLGGGGGGGGGGAGGSGGGRWAAAGGGRVDSLPEHEEANEALLHGYSTEELSQEMANLEGLMKDLSAITANQFNC